MNKKLKRFLPLILILVMVMGSIASVSAAGLAFYDGTTKTSYSPDMTDEELDELIAAIEAGNNVSKLVGDKLVNYKDYKDAITAVILEAIENEEDITAAVLAKMNDIVAGLEEQEGPGEEPGELEVIEISAINPTTIKVVFSDEVPAEAAVKANFTVSKGTLESANKTGEKEVLLTVAGLDYEDVVSVTVVKPAYVKEVRVPAVDELFEVVITTDAENNTIKSDGASMTMVTAQIIEKSTNEPVVRDAQIQFTTTLGSLSQPQVALQNGKASTQLRSISSPTSVTAVVSAVVASAPGAEIYVGLNGTKRVNFTPDGTDPGAVEMVSPVSAGADQGDRFFVSFSGDIDANAYKNVLALNPTLTAITGMGVQYVDKNNVNQDIDVVDVYNIRPDTLMFVLDTDTTGSVIVPATMIDRDYSTTAAPMFLRDNVNHKIIFPQNIPGKVVASSAITFMMSDVTKPFVYGVEAIDNMNLKVRFSESIAEDLAETDASATTGVVRLATQLNEHFTIDGKKLRLYEGAANAPNQTDVDLAKAANEIIVTALEVGKYTSKNNDTRNIVSIKIHKDFRLATGTHGIQIAKVGDWAGMTDQPQNLVTTQTFNFTVGEDTGVPNVTVVDQSPEQWLITFNKPVDTVTGKNVNDAIKIYTKKGYNDDPKTKLTHSANSATGDYILNEIDEDGMLVAPIAPGANLVGVERILVEFNRDWSKKLEGNTEDLDNYWKSGISPFKVVIGEVESVTGVKMDTKALNVAPPYDGESPYLVEAVDLYEMKPDEAFRTITKAGNSASGRFVFVRTNEPVQLLEDVGGTTMAISNPVTPSIKQDPAVSNVHDSVTGLPVATYRFIKGDKTVYGNVRDLAEDDMTFVIEPDTTLTPGTWTLYIEQLSDDHGNTSATVNRKVVVPESAAVETAVKVAWIAFDNHDANPLNDQFDYLYIKYTEEMKAYTANGVDDTTNYKFRGYDLPEGSRIFAGIDGVTDNWDGVTIRMPKTAWDGIDGDEANFSTNVTVASNFTSKDGVALSSPFQVELTDTKFPLAHSPFVDKDGLVAGDFEAVYLNADVSVLLGEAAAVTAEATDSDADGDIDTITVTFNSAITPTLTAADYILVNGKKFIWDGSNFVANGIATTGSLGAQEIAGTASDNLVITAPDGALLFNKGMVVDRAGVVVLKAEGEVGSKVVVLTLSEAAYGSGALGKIDATNDFTLTPETTGTSTVAGISKPDDAAAGSTKVTIELDANAVTEDFAAGTATTFEAATGLVDKPTFLGLEDKTATPINNAGVGTAVELTN